MTTKEIMAMSIDDLIADAVARKDKEALLWLQQEANRKDVRKKDGKNVEVAHSVISLKFDYAKKFLGYSPKDKVKDYAELRRRSQEKKKRALDEKFAEALKAIEE